MNDSDNKINNEYPCDCTIEAGASDKAALVLCTFLLSILNTINKAAIPGIISAKKGTENLSRWKAPVFKPI